MKSFKLAEPKTVEQVTSFLAKEKGKAFLMAGGTDLLAEIKEELLEPEIVVDLRSIPNLSYIRKEKDGVHIGAMTALAELASDPIIKMEYRGLHEAAQSVGSPQLRNMGTVGGNLCQRPRCWYYRDPQLVCRKKGGSTCFAFQGRNKYHAIFGGGLCYIVHPSDLAPALLSLDAEILIASSRGEKSLPLLDFYTLPSVNVQRENTLAADEVLREIRIPLAKKNEKTTYLKFKERGAWDFAVVSAAVKGTLQGAGFSDIRIVLGGVAPVPWRLKKAEDSLKGKKVTEALLKQVAQEALQEAKPLKENEYKKDLVEVILSRAVASLLKKA